jgi:Ca-activated chloride channel family protein
MAHVLPTFADHELDLGAPSDGAGFGSLKTERGNLPLEALDVRARIDGLLYRAEIDQVFVNATGTAIEATYIFPLPPRAAVTAFRLAVGDRTIEGVLEERAKARETYDAAIKAGHRAAIAEEDRPDVFNLRVGNLPAGERARVSFVLAGPLPYSDGEATFRFPLVVAPRYIPGIPLPGPSVGGGTAPDTNLVPDASRITPPVLLPGFPNPVRLSLRVDLDPAGLPVSDLRSSLHAVVDEEAEGARRIALRPGERLDRDFVLRFRVGDDALRTSLVVSPDGEAGSAGESTFLLTAVPPAGDPGARRPRDVAFVLDRSGSMGGWKVVAARRAMARMVDTLGPADRFAVLAFDNTVEAPPGLPAGGLAPASDRDRFRAVEFLAGVEARGGTEMMEPLRRAADLLAEGARTGRDAVLVLVTDGQVGNEDALLEALASKLGVIRVFVLGIDVAVNEGFLGRLAAAGGGWAETVESEDRLDEVLAAVHRRIATPVLTGMRIEAEGLPIVEGSIVPSRLPDLFEGVPLVVLGRSRGAAGSIRVTGTMPGGEPWSCRAEAAAIASPAAAGSRPAARPVWARAQVRQLEDRYAAGEGDRQAIEAEIVGTSLRFGVLSRFTAYVAVDRSAVVNEGGEVHRIVQPVEMPRGWEMPAAAAPGAMGMMCRYAPSLSKKRLTSDAVFCSPEPAGASPRDLARRFKDLEDLLRGRRKMRPLRNLLRMLEDLALFLRGIPGSIPLAERAAKAAASLDERLAKGLPDEAEFEAIRREVEDLLREARAALGLPPAEAKPRPGRLKFWKR